jgi:mono/diheme cytochrome c family protein
MQARLTWSIGALTVYALCAGCHRPSAENGVLLFARNCARCHVPHEGDASPAPVLTGYFDRKPRPTVKQARQIIRDGKRYMPPFGKRLSADEIEDLIAYMKTLR